MANNPNNRFSWILLGFLFLLISGCNKSTNDDPPDPPDPPAGNFAKGADISWLTEMEAAGKKFFNAAGVEKDCMVILKDLGINAVRLRVWVNPMDAWCNTADVVAKAIRAKNLGMKIMIDFHYSDTWADPGHQETPAAWAAMDLGDLRGAVFNHTQEVLVALDAVGILPDWVQIGNETNDGFLWPIGKASVSMANFGALISAAFNGVKSVNASINVIVHLSNGNDNVLFRWMFDGLKANSFGWNIIGMSLYPTPGNWQTMNQQCLANMNDMVERYGTPVMICEVGMSWDQPAACKAFLADLIAKTKSVKDNKGLGVFYWEPESYDNWKGYTLGAFDNSGKPTEALDAFK